jgi:hypothetical protein
MMQKSGRTPISKKKIGTWRYLLAEDPNERDEDEDPDENQTANVWNSGYACS